MTLTTEFPSPAAYSRAVQVSSRFHADLRSTSIRDGVMPGLPLAFAGSNAIVFPIDDVDGSAWALRLFTNPLAAVSGRYRALERFQDAAPLTWPARCRWLDEAIRIGDDWFPGLRMELIDGVLFDQYVLQLASADDRRSLRALAADWREMVSGLQEAGFAHGDLQHGNVMVETGTGSLRLVDFDGVWLPELADEPPSERGHGSYQHPRRLTADDWGPLVDTFAGLVVYLSLLALADDPTRRRHTVIGSHLLLSEAELVSGTGPDSMALTELATAADPEVRALTALLIDWLGRPANRPEPLAQLLDGAAPTSSGADRPLPPTGPWWGLPGPVGPASGQDADDGATAAETPPTRPVTTSSGPLERHRAEGRARPSRDDIRNQMAVNGQAPSPPLGVAPSPRSTPLAAPPDNPASTAPAPPTLAPPAPTATSAGAPEARPRSAVSGTFGRRVVAAVIDAVLGTFVVLHLVWMADGAVPGKQSVDLVVRRTNGDAPSYGRLVLRELVLKQLAVQLVLVGMLAGIAPLAAVAGGWLAAGGVFALGSSGRTLWDRVCDTEVIAAENTEPPDRSRPSSEPTQEGAVWW